MSYQLRLAFNIIVKGEAVFYFVADCYTINPGTLISDNILLLFLV